MIINDCGSDFDSSKPIPSMILLMLWENQFNISSCIPDCIKEEKDSPQKRKEQTTMNEIITGRNHREQSPITKIRIGSDDLHHPKPKRKYKKENGYSQASTNAQLFNYHGGALFAQLTLHVGSLITHAETSTWRL